MFMSFYAIVCHTQSDKKAIEMLDSILKRDGYVAFNQYEEQVEIGGTTVSLFVMKKDGSYISKRPMVYDTCMQYANKWEIRNDTLILFEDNTMSFLDKNDNLRPDSDLFYYRWDYDRYIQYSISFGRLFTRNYEVGHSFEWRNMVTLEVKTDSIGLYLKPVNYGYSQNYKIEILFRHVSMPLSYLDNFRPYFSIGNTPIKDSPFQMVRFPYLTYKYGLDVDSLRKAYNEVFKSHSGKYSTEYIMGIDSLDQLFHICPPKDINSKKQKYEELMRDTNGK